MRELSRFLAALLFVVFFFGCAASADYYTSRFDYGVIGRALESVAFIETKGAFEMPDGARHNYTLKALCFPLKKGFLVALSHTTGIPETVEMKTPFGLVEIPVKSLEESFTIAGRPVQLVGRSGDISVFKADFITNSPFRLGDSSKLKVGSEIFVIGFSLAKDLNFKSGVVSALKISKEYQEDDKKILFNLPDFFLHTIPTNFGDSGAPVFAQRSGVCEVVGIVNATVPVAKGVAFAINSNAVREHIRKIVEKSGNAGLLGALKTF